LIDLIFSEPDMHALVALFLISIAVLMGIRGLSALIRRWGEDSPFAAPEAPAIDSYSETEAGESSSRMITRN
jgi:hypothetical protein